MFFNSVKSCEVKKCKIDKHMELGLYCQPIINFQEPKSKGTSWEMYLKILICSKYWKNSTLTTASPMSSIFQVNLVFLSTFFCPGTTLNSLNFQQTYLIAIIVWGFCFDLQRVVSRIKTFKVLLFLTKLYLKMSFECYNAYS